MYLNTMYTKIAFLISPMKQKLISILLEAIRKSMSKYTTTKGKRRNNRGYFIYHLIILSAI